MLLDPIKSTIITRGWMDGEFADPGIPASIVTKYLAEHGVVVEKTGLYSFFIMFTIGITKGRWNTLVTALQQFRTITTATSRCGACCRNLSPSIPRTHGPARPVRQRSTSIYARQRHRPPDHRDVPVADQVPGGETVGRVRRWRTATPNASGRRAGRPHHRLLLTPYPPGIPLLIPGERFNKKIASYPSSRGRCEAFGL